MKSDISNGLVEKVLISTYVAQQAIVEIMTKNNSEDKYITLY